jgi:hypothetical protein
LAGKAIALEQNAMAKPEFHKMSTARCKCIC